MDKPIWYWNNTLRRLGLKARRKHANWQRPKGRSLQLENLESRQLLAAPPIEVFTFDGLQAMQGNLERDHVLMADIVAPPGSSFNPIGTGGAPFTGSLDGQGHTITGLTISSSSEYVGLFGATEGAEISKVGLVDVEVEGSNYVGGLIGRSLSSTVVDCYATGAVEGGICVGGLVGYSSNSGITRCFAAVDVNDVSSYYGGGLVGRNRYHATITDSYATGDVGSTGAGRLGGLVGHVDDDSGAITNCYAAGNVTGYDNLGGLVGSIEANSPPVQPVEVNGCFAVGDVDGYTGDSYVGPLVGYSGGADLADCYYAGSATNAFGGGTSSFGILTTVAALRGRTCVDTPYSDWAIYGDAGASDVWIMAGLPHLQMEYDFIAEEYGKK